MEIKYTETQPHQSIQLRVIQSLSCDRYFVVELNTIAPSRRYIIAPRFNPPNNDVIYLMEEYLKANDLPLLMYTGINELQHSGGGVVSVDIINKRKKMLDIHYSMHQLENKKK